MASESELIAAVVAVIGGASERHNGATHDGMVLRYSKFNYKQKPQVVRLT
jgi:hypothetical protein